MRYGECPDVRVYTADKHAHVSVTDRGNGIPESELEAVFTPFYRLEHSRNRNTGGVGLGLSIVRTIARQHGGEISLINRDGGLETIISLPETRQAAEIRGGMGQRLVLFFLSDFFAFRKQELHQVDIAHGS